MMIHNNELISIIMPAFCVESIIQDSINSVLGQTYNNWELLVSDDCSSDKTASVVAAASRHDPRIRLIQCKVNGGPAAARNAALAQARGRWIAFLDSDDLWLPDKLKETIRYALTKNSGITFTGFRRITYDKNRIGKYIAVPSTLTYSQLLGNTAITTSTVLLDRNIVGNVLMKNVYYDDFVCWLEVLRAGVVAHGLNKDLMRYRIVLNSVSRNKFRSAFEVWKIYTQIEKLGYTRSLWCFLNYAFHAFSKYRIF